MLRLKQSCSCASVCTLFAAYYAATAPHLYYIVTLECILQLPDEWVGGDVLISWEWIRLSVLLLQWQSLLRNGHMPDTHYEAGMTKPTRPPT